MKQRELETPEKKDKGFTLVELLIVIVILGILATVTVFAVRGITDSAETSVCETEVAEVQTAVEAYFVQNDAAYPANVASLVPTYLRATPATGVTIDGSTGAVAPVTAC